MEKGVPVSVWPEWQLVEKIGEGSFGKVYKAQRTERGRTFYSAIKIISIPGNKGELDSVRSEMNDEQSTREYFRNLVEDCVQEIYTMEHFCGNSHIVSFEDFKVVEYLDEIGWDIYIRMEYLTSFMDYCTGKELTEKEVMKLGCDLSMALIYCRKLNIIHRDVKPGRIFLYPDSVTLSWEILELPESRRTQWGICPRRVPTPTWHLRFIKVRNTTAALISIPLESCYIS